MSVNEKMTAIADNIREKTGGAEALTLDDMASGVNEVYEAGKTKEWSDFWDNYLGAYYSEEDPSAVYMFAGRWWNDKTFKPNRDIVLSWGNANRMFYNTGITDLEAALQKQGVILDTKNLIRVDEMFYRSKVTTVPELDIRNVGYGSVKHLNSLFGSCPDLHTVRKLRISDKYVATIGTAFSGCTSLANIEFEGCIQTDASFSVCPLTVESMKSIITHLKDFSGTTSEFTCTVTFKASAFEVLEGAGFTEEDKDWLTSVGQTYSEDLTWATVIDNLKWNLTLA